MVQRLAGEAGIPLLDLPDGLRLRRTRSHVFAFNYSAAPIDTAPLGLGTPDLGEAVLSPAQVAAWSRS